MCHDISSCRIKTTHATTVYLAPRNQSIFTPSSRSSCTSSPQLQSHYSVSIHDTLRCAECSESTAPDFAAQDSKACFSSTVATRAHTGRTLFISHRSTPPAQPPRMASASSTSNSERSYGKTEAHARAVERAINRKRHAPQERATNIARLQHRRAGLWSSSESETGYERSSGMVNGGDLACGQFGGGTRGEGGGEGEGQEREGQEGEGQEGEGQEEAPR